MTVKHTMLSGSVGRGGTNRSVDVAIVQRLLNGGRVRARLPTIEIDGIAGPETQQAIVDFEQKLRIGTDGRIDPDGPSIKALLAQHFAQVRSGLYVRLARKLSATGQSTVLEPVSAAAVLESLRNYMAKVAAIRSTAQPGPRSSTPPPSMS
jgi:peptidoglycan hydrolase-like protein with peptidoglycan-binding domain